MSSAMMITRETVDLGDLFPAQGSMSFMLRIFFFVTRGCNPGLSSSQTIFSALVTK